MYCYFQFVLLFSICVLLFFFFHKTFYTCGVVSSYDVDWLMLTFYTCGLLYPLVFGVFDWLAWLIVQGYRLVVTDVSCCRLTYFVTKAHMEDIQC